MDEFVEKTEKKSIGTWKAFAGMITSPGKTFGELLESPRVWLPNLYLGLLTLLVTAPFYSKILEYARLTASNAPQPQVQQGLDPSIMDNILIGTTIFGIVLSAAAPFIASVVIATLLKVLNQVMGEKTDYSKLLTVCTFAQVPIVFGTLLRNLLVMNASGDNLIYAKLTGTSLAAFLPHDVSLGILFLILSAIDVFAIWSLVLVSIGTAKAFRTSATFLGGLIIGLSLVFTIGLNFLTSTSTINMLSK